MEIKRSIILFADIQGSTEFGFTQPVDKYNEMLRDFHKTAYKAVQDFLKKHSLDSQRVVATCRGDECCVFLMCDKVAQNELLAIELAVYLKEKWKASDFCKRNWQAADTGLIPQVDLRIGIGSGNVVIDDDVWSHNKTVEGIVISEAKRIEGMADMAKETLIIVKWDIKEACIKAGAEVKFGDVERLRGKGIPDHHDIPLYPVLSYKKWQKIQTEVVPSPTTIMEQLNRALALHLSGNFESAIIECTAVLKRDEKLASAWMLRGAAYAGLKRYKEALADYNRSLELRPDDSDTLNNRGSAYFKLERYKEALADDNRSLGLRPDHPVLLSNRGKVYSKLKRYKEALADFNRSLELRPDHLDTLYDLACLFSLWNKPDDAITYLEKAIKANDKYRKMAREDKDFDNIRADPRFKKIIESS